MEAPLPGTDGGAQDLIPARFLNEFVYCPRLCYIEWVEGDFEDNEHTIEGRTVHRNADKPAATVPLGGPEQQLEDVIHTRSAYLSSQEKGLVCKIDIIEGEGNSAIPVDYKKGAVPDCPGNVWPPEAVQLCAQALILEDNGMTVPHGVIYFAESKRRITVPLTEQLRQQTLGAAAAMRQMRELAVLPSPLKSSPKCEGCSLAGICLPDEILLLKELALMEEEQAAKQPDDRLPMEAEVPEEYREKVRRLYPPRDDALPLYVQEQGAYLGKRDENLVVTKKGEVVAESHLFSTSQVCLLGAVQMSQQAVKECLGRNIPICHFSFGGYFLGLTSSLSHKNVQLRLAQYKTHISAEQSLDVTRRIIGGKIRNQRTLLRRNGGAGLDAVILELKNLAVKAEHAESCTALMAVEANAAAIYFSHFQTMLKPKEGNELAFSFNERNRRPPKDPINALLSLAYSMLAKDCFLALWSAGFDPHLGFFHRPKYGKPSLALDVMEEFRALVADSVVLWVVNNGVLDRKDFRFSAAGVNLTTDGRRKFIQAYERRMDTLVTHALFDYRLSYRRLIAVQVRILGRVIQGEFGPDFFYPVFVTR